MPTLESFLMGKALPVMQLSQELPMTPFQIGVPSFILPYTPLPMLSSALSAKHSNPACQFSVWGAGFVWGQWGERMEVPLSSRLSAWLQLKASELLPAAAFAINPSTPLM